jgi:hypothetical protein
VQRSTNKKDISAEEYGKASVHTRLHNPENSRAVVQTTSENDNVAAGFRGTVIDRLMEHRKRFCPSFPEQP